MTGLGVFVIFLALLRYYRTPLTTKPVAIPTADEADLPPDEDHHEDESATRYDLEAALAIARNRHAVRIERRKSQDEERET